MQKKNFTEYFSYIFFKDIISQINFFFVLPLEVVFNKNNNSIFLYGKGRKRIIGNECEVICARAAGELRRHKFFRCIFRNMGKIVYG